MQVVLLHQMGAGAIDQRGKIRRGGLAVDQNTGRAGARAHLRRVAFKQRDRVRALTGQGRSQPVEKQLFSTADNGFG